MIDQSYDTRVMRGGSWAHDAVVLRCGFRRGGLNLLLRLDRLGFRVVVRLPSL
jgi:formylglycine-generating enzyme required for sulfatase activity